MKKPIALALLLAALMPAAAHAGPIVLPETAPIPAARPATTAALPLNLPEPVAISTTPMPIPESRLDVRVVGSRFLPAPSEDIDFASPAGGEIELLARSVEWFIATASTRLLEDADAEAPQQTAAIDGQRVSVLIGSGAD